MPESAVEMCGHASQETCSHTGWVSTGVQLRRGLSPSSGGMGVTARVASGWLDREVSIAVGDSLISCLSLRLRKTLQL